MLDRLHPVAHSADPGRFTTVASWRGAYGTVEHDGRHYGLKVHEFRKLAGLPARVPDAWLEVALAIDPADTGDRDSLVAGGWHLVDPVAAVRDPVRYRDYVQRSSAEFSPAQGIYVDTEAAGSATARSATSPRAGRRSCRTRASPTTTRPRSREGFTSPEDAAREARRIAARHQAHAAAARALAEERFDSEHVLPRFLEQAGVT